MAGAQPIRNIQTEQNFGQVERARTKRQVSQEKRVAPANDNTRNSTVVRFGEQGGRATPAHPANAAYPDTASQFRENYARAGLQPSTIDAAPLRGAAKQHTPDPTRAQQVQYYHPEPAAQSSHIPKVKRKKKKPNAALRELARVRASGINLWVIGISTTLFLPMLLLTILNGVFLGLAYFVENLFSTAKVSESNDTITVDGRAFNGLYEKFGDALSSVFVGVSEALFTAINAITIYSFGIDLTIFNPLNLFSVTYVASIGVGLTLLLLMYLMYSISFIKSLSGSHAGTKQIAFMIALVGHSIPLMSLFPWFLVWAATVWLYPK